MVVVVVVVAFYFPYIIYLTTQDFACLQFILFSFDHTLIMTVFNLGSFIYPNLLSFLTSITFFIVPYKTLNLTFIIP